MKKTVFLTALVLCVVVFTTSCVSTDISQTNTKMNQISSEDLVVNTFMNKEDYRIIGTVRGESDFVYYSYDSEDYVGDSHNYGYINDRMSASISEGYYVGTGRIDNSFYIPESALDIAKLNALYNMIQEANNLEADFILEPSYTIESKPSPRDGELMYKVTVKALAAKILY